MAPTIETARLTLRGHRADDLAASAAMWADPEITRYIGGKPPSEQDVWFKVLRYAGLWALMGFGYWAIEEKATGEYVGELGFADFMRDIEPSIRGVPELGWALVSRVHGKGYATEAVAAAVAWGDAHLTSSLTVCIISLGNVQSIRVAVKCGYEEKQRTVYHGEPTILFERQKNGAPSTKEPHSPQG
ncbi:MAG: acetyltransferase, family [Candidatus Eremiobacteraeota bacterium]|nr:acetyltransferase, family [Candidatus Eremiobacteraeota bacterium]